MEFYDQYPAIDLHGMNREIAQIAVKEFIEDYSKLGYPYIVIIHGIGSGILRDCIKAYLKKDKHVLEYKLSFMNPGCTIVKLKKIDKKQKKKYNK